MKVILAIVFCKHIRLTFKVKCALVSPMQAQKNTACSGDKQKKYVSHKRPLKLKGCSHHHWVALSVQHKFKTLDSAHIGNAVADSPNEGPKVRRTLFFILLHRVKAKHHVIPLARVVWASDRADNLYFHAARQDTW